MDSIDFGSFTVSSDLHPLNVHSPILSTDFGISMEISDTQLLKAKLPMLSTESGILSSTRDLHPLNAESPILSTESGIIIDSKASNSLKAKFPILVTESGITTLLVFLFLRFETPLISVTGYALPESVILSGILMSALSGMIFTILTDFPFSSGLYSNLPSDHMFSVKLTTDAVGTDDFEFLKSFHLLLF